MYGYIDWRTPDVAPVFTLRLMMVPEPGEGLIFIRFIGAFVFAIGFLYFCGLLAVVRNGSWRGVRSMLWVTAWVRAVIFLFTAIAIVSGNLPLAWISVPLSDGLLAFGQVLWIFMGGVPEDG